MPIEMLKRRMPSDYFKVMSNRLADLEVKDVDGSITLEEEDELGIVQAAYGACVYVKMVGRLNRMYAEQVVKRCEMKKG